MHPLATTRLRPYLLFTDLKPNGATDMTKQITFEGAKWNVIGTGVEIGENTMCHLGSTTNGTQQKNGFVPVQILVPVPTELLRNQ
jgi:hypothetical protein